MATIVFNGKPYNSLEDMSPNDRLAYEQMMTIFVDKNGNGIPDFLEGDIVQNVMTAFTSGIHVNGTAYDGMNELPEDVRAKVQDAFQKMSELGIVTNTTPPMTQANDMQVSKEPQFQSRPLVSREYSPALQEEDGSKLTPWLLVAVALLFCLAAAVFAIVYFFIR